MKIIKRNLILSILLSLLFLSQAYSQPPGSTDSLSQALSELPNDSLRMIHLTKRIEKLVYSNPNQAMREAMLADSIASINGDSLLIGFGFNLKGMAHYSVGTYDASLANYLSAISILEKIDHQGSLGRVYNNLAGTYQVTGDLEGSIKYFEKALANYSEVDDSILIVHTKNNLAIQYMNKGDLEKADAYFTEVLPLYEALQQELYLGIACLNYGNLKVEKEEYTAAITYFQRAMALVPREVNILLQAAAHGGIGVSHARIGRLQNAENHLLNSINLAKEINHFEQLKVSREELTNVYEQQGRLQDALNMHRAYTQSKDSLHLTQQDQKLIDAMQKYEVVEKEKEIVLLNTKNQVAELKLINSRKMMFGLLTALILFSAFLYYLWSLNKTIKRQNKTISKTLKERETLLREIHHRVKNNLQFISSLLSLQSRHVEDINAKSALKGGQDRVRSMALIHQNLYQEDSLTGIDVQEYFGKLTHNLLDSYDMSTNQIAIHLNIEPVSLDVDTLIPLGLIVNELISNALKHAFPNGGNGEISVTLKEEGDVLLVNVSDSGIGMPDPANLVENDSFGYRLIDALKIQLDAELDIHRNSGTSVSLKVLKYRMVA